MKHRITVTVEPDQPGEALDLFEAVHSLLLNEGYDPDECAVLEYERVSWEPVYVPARESERADV